jgi:DNA-binding HxlR family transcriptional regulator
MKYPKELKSLPANRQADVLSTVTQKKSIVCPFNKLLEVLGKPHTLQILYGLSIRSPMRFGEIQTLLKVQPKTLTSRLHELNRMGLIERAVYNQIPPRVDYALTQKGRDLGIMFRGFREWAKKYDMELGMECH